MYNVNECDNKLAKYITERTKALRAKGIQGY
jgi:hypothetical protein